MAVDGPDAFNGQSRLSPSREYNLGEKLAPPSRIRNVSGNLWQALLTTFSDTKATDIRSYVATSELNNNCCSRKVRRRHIYSGTTHYEIPSQGPFVLGGVFTCFATRENKNARSWYIRGCGVYTLDVGTPCITAHYFSKSGADYMVSG